MTEEYNRRKSDRWTPRRALIIKLAFAVLTIIFFLILVGFAKVIHDVQGNSGRINELVAQNSFRIEDIQKSRVESCRRTYQGIREVFRPFFPPNPRTLKQIQDLEKFNNQIDSLRAACIKQTKPKHEPPKKGNQ